MSDAKTIIRFGARSCAGKTTLAALLNDGHYNLLDCLQVTEAVRGRRLCVAVPRTFAEAVEAGGQQRAVAAEFQRIEVQGTVAGHADRADPRGLDMAVSAMQGVEFVGMPEARIILSQATTYLASAPKSNAAYLAVDEAMKDVEEGRTLAVPMHLRNVKVKSVDGKQGGEYVYPHECEGHFAAQEYAPTTRRYYRPTNEGYEATLRKRMAHWATQREQQGGTA